MYIAQLILVSALFVRLLGDGVILNLLVLFGVVLMQPHDIEVKDELSECLFGHSINSQLSVVLHERLQRVPGPLLLVLAILQVVTTLATHALVFKQPILV